MADINLYTMVLNRVASFPFFVSSKNSPFSFRKNKDFRRTMLPRAQNSMQHIIKQQKKKEVGKSPAPGSHLTKQSVHRSIHWCALAGILYYRMVPIATPGRVYFIREKTCGDRDEWMNGTYSHFSMCAQRPIYRRYFFVFFFFCVLLLI